MDLLAAIDLRGGEAVRLVQGDFGREQGYGDPVDLARRFVKGGARWLHVVDLDAARTGEPVNREVVLEIAARAGVPVQAGGGVRAAVDVDELLGAGVGRVVLGTAALEDPDLAVDLAERHPGRVALGLDYRRRDDGALEAASRGWTAGSGRTVSELLERVGAAALGAVVVTAIERDGTLAGPDLDGLADVLSLTGLPVVASGGVGSAADLRALAALGVAPATPDGPVRRLAGAVVGKALVDGRVELGEAIAACATSG